MEEPEKGSSPTKPKWPFEKQVWFKTSMLGKRRVPVEPMKNKCRNLLQLAQGRVIAKDPDISTKTKELLIDTSEEILASLDKGLQLRVLDPEKLQDLMNKNRPLAKQVREKCEQLEHSIKRAEMLRDQLKQQYEQENRDKTGDQQSAEGSHAGDSPDNL